KRIFQTGPRVPKLRDRCQVDSTEIQIGGQRRDCRWRRNVGSVTAGKLLELPKPALKLAVRDLEAAQVVLELVEFRLPRGAIGVELALDAIHLGVERDLRSIARGGQRSLDVRPNLRLDRGAGRVCLRGQPRGVSAGLLGGLA